MQRTPGDLADAPYSVKLRRAIVRLLLLLSVILQIGYLTSLPLGDPGPATRLAIVTLCALLASTTVGIFTLGRYPRAALALLGVGSAICLWWLYGIAPWTMALHILEGRATVTPIAFVSAVLASVTCLIVPLASVLAWPLRREATESV